jgi:hypothetical protein
VPRLFGVGRVAQQDADPLGLGELPDAGEIGAAVVHGGQVELEVAGVDDRPLGRVHDDRVGVRDAVGDRHELDVEGPDADALTVADRVERRAAEQPGLLDAVARQAEREPGAVDRHRHLAQQELDATDVVLVAVRGHEPVDARRVLLQVREVRQDQVDPVHVGTGEHQAAVDEQQAAVVAAALLDRHAVAPDLAQAPQEDDADGGLVRGISHDGDLPGAAVGRWR